MIAAIGSTAHVASVPSRDLLKRVFDSMVSTQDPIHRMESSAAKMLVVRAL